MNTQGKVSMVMPCYNKVKYIGNMFDSIIAQEWNNIELILVNDGSTDGTREMITRYESNFTARGYEVVIIDQDNAGVCAAAKAGFERVTGDYVCCIDADDELDPQYCSTMASWLEVNQDYDYCVCDYLNFKTADGKKEYFDNYFGITPMSGFDMTAQYLLGDSAKTVWIYMVRASYLNKIEIRKYCPVTTKGSHEPGFVIPLTAFTIKFKVFRKVLYFVRKDDEYTHSSFRSIDDAIKYNEDYLVLRKYAINELPKDKINEAKLKIYIVLADLYYHKCLINYSYNTKDENYFRNMADMIECLMKHFCNYHKLISRVWNLKWDLNAANKLLSVIYHSLSNSYDVLHKANRVIAYGASGRRARRLLPSMQNTVFKPITYWDATPDHECVRKPVWTELCENDILLVFPISDAINGYVKSKVKHTNINYVFYTDDLDGYFEFGNELAKNLTV